MRAPDDSIKTGGRLSGDDVQQYLEDFAERFLKGKIRFETEVLNVHRRDNGRGWKVLVRDRRTGGSEKVSYFSRIVLCTGVSFHRYCRVDLRAHRGLIFYLMDSF